MTAEPPTLPPVPSTPLPKSDEKIAFRSLCLRLLVDAGVPFLVGGAYALRQHCGIERDTKDVDVFVRPRHLEPALAAFEAAGYRTARPFPHWLAKAYDHRAREGDDAEFVDLIHNSGNGLTPVDDEWFEHATHAHVLGVRVAICPVEEAIWSKAFVMERERFDGADVAHLLHANAKTLDWKRLLRRFAEHAPVLFAHLVLFSYAYPSRAGDIPTWVWEELAARSSPEARSDPSSKRCNGTLLSRGQYLKDLASGYVDGRLGPMTAAEIQNWTDAIAKK